MKKALLFTFTALLTTILLIGINNNQPIEVSEKIPQPWSMNFQVAEKIPQPWSMNFQVAEKIPQPWTKSTLKA